MSSPPRDSSTGSVRGGSPVRHRDSTSIHDAELNRSRVSPTLARSFDPNDPQVRERQRTMDVDMAMQLSRARRETISNNSSPYENPHAENEPATLTALSPHEQHELDMARGDTDHLDGIDEDSLLPKRQTSTIDLRTQMLNSTQDPALLVSNSQYAPRPSAVDDPSSSIFGGLPTYQPNASRSHFDFSSMEEFAQVEKTTLGLTSLASPRITIPHTFSTPNMNAEAASDSTPRPSRQRKLSQSTTPRRKRKGIGGKLALFEGNFGEPPPSLPDPFGPPFDDLNRASSSQSGPSHLPQSTPTGLGGILNVGHDRPYRFSFYSNALSSTIHARSLSELPAEGQTFEDLFTGISADSTSTPPRDPPPGDNSKRSSMAKPPANSSSYFPGKVPQTRMINGGMGQPSDEGTTWWLDVQSPTDEEMKLLSKVFNIHPLTTEDIQMEETREKIELFRNYYLVCFRSFDQDPYSPTHLEPLNMYIIVFREGTMSFHFRPTPHPQNVRRRIKHLKDYISVTSDWISYALIDDITDAFGPLIQSIEYEVDSIDELVLILKEAEETGDMLRRIGRCRKKVMGLLRLMGNKADVVKGLAKRCNENWQVAPTSDIGLYLSDIQDHLITMTQNLNHYEKILSRSHSNYLAQISIEMTDANNQINDVLSKLTALGTVLIPMNLVTGLWGMNVHVPGEGREDFVWFASIIACLAAFAFIGGYSTYRFMLGRR